MLKNNMTFSLFKILFKNIFSLSDFLAGFKKGPKSVIKNILIFLCLLYCFGAFGFLYVISMNTYYQLFEMQNAPDAITVLGLLSTTVIILFFGFISTAANYYTGQGEEQFRAMPLTSKNIFGAKFAISFVTDAIFGVLMFSISSIIYGYNQHLMKNPLFYAGFLVSAITISLLCIFVIYLIFILILSVFPGLRKKSFLTAISTFLIIVFSIGYSLFYSTTSVSMEEVNLNAVQPTVQTIIRFSKESAVIKFLVSAVKGNIFSILIILAIGLCVVYGLLPLLSNSYINTLNGFSDIKTKRMNSQQIQETVNKEIKTTSMAKALYIRDIRSVLREPAFLSNGPLMVVLFPVIIIFSFGVGLFASGIENLSEMIMGLQEIFLDISEEGFQNLKFYLTVGLIGFAVFTGNSSNIASTSFSREGKSFYNLKAMPIEWDDILFSKFWHAFTYILVAIIETLILFLICVSVLKMPFSIQELFQIILISTVGTIVISLLNIYVDMFIDTANPKLNWENPIAAFKQNFNSVFSVFILMGVVAVFVVISVVLPKTNNTLVYVFAFFGVIDAVLGSGYFRYARKKLPKL